MPAATRPLLRQIDSLQANVREQGEVWGRMESEMRARVKELELALMKARQEKVAVEEGRHRVEMELAERELSTKTLRERLATADSAARSSRKLHEQATDRLAEMERQVEQLQQAVDEHKKEKTLLEERLRKLVEERRTADSRQQQQIAAEVTARQLAEQQLTLLKASGPQLPLRPSAEDMKATSSPPPSSPPLSSHPTSASSSISLSSSSSLAFSLPPGSPSSALHWTTVQLRADLRQKDGEVAALRSELRGLERVRLELSEALVEAQGRVAGMAVLERRVVVLEGGGGGAEGEVRDGAAADRRERG